MIIADCYTTVYGNIFIVKTYRKALSSEFTQLLFDFHQKKTEKIRL